MSIFNKQFNQELDVSYLKGRLDIDEVKQQAEKIILKEFSFVRPWDMEACYKDYPNHDLDWNLVANGDEEWTFMLNRFDYLKAPVLMYLMTKKSFYKDIVVELIEDWMSKHEVVEYSLSTRTLDTAIRIDAWIHAVKLISAVEPVDDIFLERMKESIVKQIEYMYEHYITKYTLSNWGSIQTSVIIRVMPLVDSDYMNHDIYKWAIKELQDQMNIQIYDDGLLWEQSTMYHVEVLKNYIKVYEVNPFEELKNLIKKMTQSLIHLTASEFYIESFGDSDRTSVKDICTYAAVALNDSSLKLENDVIDDSERLYEMSFEQIKKYEAMVSLFDLNTYFDGLDSGIHTIRSSWEKDASFWMFSNGSLGSGHGHSDNLHLSFYGRGKPLLVDPGRYTYREDIKARELLKDAEHHNGVTLKSKALSVPNGSWSYHQFVDVNKNYTNHKGEFHYLEGSISKDGYRHRRSILLSEKGFTMIVDDLYLEKEDEIHINFNIDHSINPIVADNRVELGGYVIKSCDDLDINIYDSIQSTRYNELHDNKKVVFETVGSGRLIFTNLLYDLAMDVVEVDLYQGDNVKMNSQQGRAFKVNDEFIFIVINEEIYKGTKILRCEDFYFHSKALVIDMHKRHIYNLRT